MRDYTKHITQEEKRKMTSYLELDSCKKIAGSVSPDTITKRNHLILYAIAALIFAIGLVFVLF